MVRPGDYVDVIAVLPDPNAGFNSDTRAAIVLLQRVLVLASGYETSPDAIDVAAKDRRPEAILTLSLKLEQAQAVAVAMEKGAIQVVLRNPNDNVREDQIPKYSSTELIKAGPVTIIQGPRIPTAIPAGNQR